ncbi:MAG: hypothetical protein LUD03_03615 [Firmicutes bacterium]|nr:hypothetical protein [Bacillota bacterium]
MYGYEIFHDNLMKSLISSVHGGAAANAYIFEGEKGLGKLSAAKLFAAALTCENAGISPCGSCPSCVEAAAGTNPDIIMFKKPADKQTIGVEPIRTLTEDVIIKPFSSEKKVYIIEDGDLLTPAAQNALLKTLEEPPEYAVFIIISTNQSALLQTVLSRSVLVHFPPVSENAVRVYLEEKYPEAENKDFIVKYCEGVPGRVDGIMADEEFYSLRNSALDYLPKLMTKSKVRAFDIKKYVEENKDDAEKIFDFWISYLRDILVMQTGTHGRTINSDKTPELSSLARKLNPKVTVSAIELIFKAKEMLRRYVSTKAVSLYLALKINSG